MFDDIMTAVAPLLLWRRLFLTGGRPPAAGVHCLAATFPGGWAPAALAQVHAQPCPLAGHLQQLFGAAVPCCIYDGCCRAGHGIGGTMASLFALVLHCKRPQASLQVGGLVSVAAADCQGGFCGSTAGHSWHKPRRHTEACVAAGLGRVHVRCLPGRRRRVSGQRVQALPATRAVQMSAPDQLLTIKAAAAAAQPLTRQGLGRMMRAPAISMWPTPGSSRRRLPS